MVNLRLIKRKIGFILCFLILIFIYFGLAYKNPFGVRSLVSNLEPYPDTLFYSVPAWNFIHGNGFRMSVFGIEIKSIVPPAYGIFLMPFFAIFNDVRAFYFGNILLGFVAIWLFSLLVKKIFRNNLALVLLLGIIFVTNFYFYTLPSLLMAENITMPILILLLLLVTEKINFKNVFLIGMLGVLLILVKVSNLPLTVVFYLICSFKILNEKDVRSNKIKKVLVLASITGIYLTWLKISGFMSSQVNTNSAVGFSASYFINNFSYYRDTILGGQTRFLWYHQKLIDIILVVFVVLGIFFGLTIKKFRLFSEMMLFVSLGLIIFMSFFYYPDTRYVFAIFPILIIFIGFFAVGITNLFKKDSTWIVSAVIAILYFFVCTQSFVDKEKVYVSLKRQVGLNFRHTEDPWNYLAMQQFNGYFKTKDNNVYLATFLPPFYVNYFYNGNYKYLPISKHQEFSDGSKDYVNRVYSGSLSDYYKKLINNGKLVYISNYYVNNNYDLWNKDLELVKKDFNFLLVSEGCLGGCDIYQLVLK